MKLLLVISSLGPGGAERVMTLLAKGLAKRGHDLTLLTLSRGEADFFAVAASVKRVQLDLADESKTLLHALRNNLRRVRAIRRAVAKISPDAVLSFMTSVNVLTIFACTGLKTRIVVSERIDPRSHRPNAAWALLRDLAYRHADAVIAQTNEAAEWFRRRLRGRSFVKAIANPAAEIDALLAADHSVTRPFVLAVGRLVHQKGFDVLIHAFESVARELSELHLAIVGEGPAEPELRRMVADRNLGARVTFLGRVNAVPALMRAATAFVLPSRYEGFPNVLLEALASELPIVSTDCPSGPREILRDGEYGLLVPCEDPEALAGAIVRIAHDADLRKRLASISPVAAARYDVDAVIAAWEQVLRG